MKTDRDGNEVTIRGTKDRRVRRGARELEQDTKGRIVVQKRH